MKVDAPNDMVHIENLSVTFPGGVQALAPISLGFRRGEITVLLGASGAGKSTLLRCLNLLVSPSQGRVGTAEHRTLSTAAVVRAHRKRTAMIFQQHQLIGRHSALKNVLTARLGYHPTWRTLLPPPHADLHIALECLERVGLFEKVMVRADMLSGGQKQRVGIARALAQQPALILADEPVASLDPTNAERFQSLLSRVCREDGITAVVSLHQLEFARRFADRIVGLAAGQVVFDGAPRQLTHMSLKRIYSNPSGVSVAATDIPADQLRKVENFQ